MIKHGTSSRFIAALFGAIGELCLIPAHAQDRIREQALSGGGQDIFVGAMGTGPDGAVDPDYQACIAGIDQDPEEGRAAALRWITDGGGNAAMHCAALADLANDLPRVAARRLFAIGEETRDDPTLAARVYAQSAQAWLAGGEPDKAVASLERAYDLMPDALELHLMAAPVFAGAERWAETKRVLDLAEGHASLNDNALILRAKARQQLDDLDGAARDTQRALNQNPENIDALILRGELVQAGYAIDPVGSMPQSTVGAFIGPERGAPN